MKRIFVCIILPFFVLVSTGCGGGGGDSSSASSSSVASDVAVLTWDPPTTNVDGSPLTDLAGFKVYYGTSSRTYTGSIDVGNVETYTVSGLPKGQTYYFAVTAYDTSGNESDYSNEVSKRIE